MSSSGMNSAMGNTSPSRPQHSLRALLPLPPNRTNPLLLAAIGGNNRSRLPSISQLVHHGVLPARFVDRHSSVHYFHRLPGTGSQQRPRPQALLPPTSVPQPRRQPPPPPGSIPQRRGVRPPAALRLVADPRLQTLSAHQVIPPQHQAPQVLQLVPQPRHQAPPAPQGVPQQHQAPDFQRLALQHLQPCRQAPPVPQPAPQQHQAPPDFQRLALQHLQPHRQAPPPPSVPQSRRQAPPASQAVPQPVPQRLPKARFQAPPGLASVVTSRVVNGVRRPIAQPTGVRQTRTPLPDRPRKPVTVVREVSREWEASVKRRGEGQGQEMGKGKGKENEEVAQQAVKRKREEMEELAPMAMEKGKWRGAGIGAKRGQRKGSPLAQVWNAGDDEDEDFRRKLSALGVSR